MNKQSITFKADEQELIKTGGINSYASNIVAYIEATFELGENWTGYDSVRAVWSNDYLTDISTVLDPNGRCIVPTEVLTDTGNVTVNLVGSISDGEELTDRLTTYPCKALTVDEDAKVEGDETESITPSQFEQFVSIVHDEVEEVTGMSAEASTLPAGSDATASYSDGVLSLGIPKGADGVDGKDGKDGKDGVTPDIDIGTVETLETGVPAYANITGTVENPSLNLGLPKGNTGDTGATGAPAGFGAVIATIDGTTGTPSVDVTASGADTAKNFAFAFHNLKGEQGEQGEQGDPGVVQDVTVNGTSVVDSNGVAVITMPELVKTVNGNPIVIDDAFGEVKNLDVELLPIQDLHGYDKPWAGGAGKNKVDIASGSITATTNLLSKELSAGTYTFSAYGKRDDNGSWRVLIADQSDVAIAAGNEASGSSITQSRVTFTLTETATLRLKLQFLNSYDTLRYERLQLELGSTATSYEPYSNICPITGHDSVTVTDTGKNLLNIAGVTLKKWRLNSNAFYTVADDSTNIVVSVTDDIVNCQTVLAYFGFGFEIGAVDYARTVSVTNYGTAGISAVALYSAYENGATRLLSGQTITIPANTSGFVAFRVDGARTFTTQIQVEYGNTPTAYESYHGQSKTVTLPHTVYGAGVGVTSGESKETWANIPSYNGETITEPWLSSMDEYVQGATPTTGAQVTYKLATPTDLSTTPTDLTLYSGDNVVSSDGDMELTYVQDMAIVIEKLENLL